MGKMIELTAADGHKLAAYVVEPSGKNAAKPRGGIVVIQEIFGVNSHIKSVADGYAADGYFAITNFDIADRYVIDALVRNDGSSLFGSEERRQWYYRLAGAWLA